MTFSTESVLLALGGGALIGVSASIMLLFLGRIAGISGIVGGVLVPRAVESRWRAWFLGGLVLGGLLLAVFAPSTLAASPAPIAVVAGAGLLVGVGTQLGGGCTSGHGVCGISRLAPRSLTATSVFMVTGALAAFLTRILLGGAS